MEDFIKIFILNKKEAKAIVHAHSTNATAISTHKKIFLLFITWLLWQEVTILNVQNMQPMGQENYLKIF